MAFLRRTTIVLVPLLPGGADSDATCHTSRDHNQMPQSNTKQTMLSEVTCACVAWLRGFAFNILHFAILVDGVEQGVDGDARQILHNRISTFCMEILQRRPGNSASCVNLRLDANITCCWPHIRMHTEKRLQEGGGLVHCAWGSTEHVAAWLTESRQSPTMHPILMMISAAFVSRRRMTNVPDSGQHGIPHWLWTQWA